MMQRQSIEELELINHLQWFITLRWIVPLAILFIVFFARLGLGVYFPLVPVLILVVIIFLYNLLFYFYFLKLKVRAQNEGFISGRYFAHIQIMVDLIALSFLIYFTGGVENPFTFYFIFHIVIASILLSIRETYFYVTLASSLIAGIVWLEYFGVIPSPPLLNFLPEGVGKSLSYVLCFTSVLISTLFFSAYLATTIVKKLRIRQKEIIELNQEVEEKILQIEQVNRKLHKLNEMKDKFLLITSHDLREPLTAVRGYMQILLKGYAGSLSEEQKKMLDRCALRLQDLLSFTEDILSLDNIAEGKMVGVFEMTKVRDVVVDSISDVMLLANNKDIKLNIDIADNLPQIIASSRDLRRSLVNILSNAIKFTPHYGTVNVKLTEDENFIKFEISDTGVGIPDEEICKIFDEFYQSGNFSREGYGLGLYIAKEIIKLHHGRIWAESSPGKGSTFSFILPK